MKPPKSRLPRPPLFLLLFVSVFGFIGLALIIFLWSAPRDGFGSPPLIVRIVGSGIAIAFMAIGFGVPLTSLRQRATEEGSHPEPFPAEPGSSATPPAAAKGYRCPHCGAVLDKSADVSPSGDVKCGYCVKWWNIHQAG